MPGMLLSHFQLKNTLWGGIIISVTRIALATKQCSTWTSVWVATIAILPQITVLLCQLHHGYRSALYLSETHWLGGGVPQQSWCIQRCFSSFRFTYSPLPSQACNFHQNNWIGWIKATVAWGPWLISSCSQTLEWNQTLASGRILFRGVYSAPLPFACCWPLPFPLPTPSLTK